MKRTRFPDGRKGAKVLSIALTLRTSLRLGIFAGTSFSPLSSKMTR